MVYNQINKQEKHFNAIQSQILVITTMPTKPESV